MNKIKFLIVTLIATISFSSCSDDELIKMLWEVSADPSENVEAIFDPSFYEQIQITSDGEGGEVTLKCTNYKTLNLIGAKNGNGQYADADCQFTAEITGAGVVKIILYKMPDGFKETKSFIHIDGREGKNSNTTNIRVIRKP